MWKKQIFYTPFEYGQYTDSEGELVETLEMFFTRSMSNHVINKVPHSVKTSGGRMEKYFSRPKTVAFQSYKHLCTYKHKR